ncbi:hypothetical protein HRD68_00730 (plasmid) [Yersinia massiliensis]|uniref:hypothetical protein n=1 Tax=Yersinia massiliensis TaxID=419257 RepID=UPI00156261CC|nr:hypothetical protein [Yersinia massiliensis]QKJ09384.1 hypothetical protein HRD68_00730 [Yersinia massiliensis]
MKIDACIIAPTASFVKQAPKKQQRVNHPAIAVEEISLSSKARARHIAKCQSKRKSVRVPAMLISELGQLLRTLELKRAYA